MLRKALQTRRLTSTLGAHRSHVIKLESTADISLLDTCIAEGVAENDILSQWVYVPMECGGVLSGLKKQGFEYHHAEKSTGVVMRWLGAGASKVPDYATHRVGVAGMVVREDGNVLLVKERKGKYWKLPGGHADLGETIPQTAVREVFEETGIKTEFKSILAFRHSHGLSHGRSDLYFVCLLSPLSTTIVRCPQELSDAAWLPPSTLSENPSELNRALAHAHTFREVDLYEQTHLITGLPSNLYYAKK